MWKQKSLDMKNLFLSPSKSSGLTKIFIKLDMVQTEQRHQRSDLQQIKHQLDTIIESINESPPQNVDEDTEHIPEEEGI